MCHQHRKTETRVKLLLSLLTCTTYLIQCSSATRITSKSLRLPPLAKDVNLVKSSGEEEHQQLYLLGLFDLKTSSSSRICDQFNLDANHDTWQRPMQNIEAFLWAIDQVNADSNLLPDVKLGSIILDTCSSHLRTVMQLSQFLQDRPQDLGKLPQAHQVAAVINDVADWPTLEATLRLLNQMKTTTFVTQSRSSKFERLIQEYEQDDEIPMFRTSTSNEHLADAVTEFVKQMNWTYLSVVYDERGDMLDLNERLMEKLPASGVQVALNEKVEENNLWRLFHQLSAKESLGARIVISLVSPSGAQVLLNYLRNMRRQQQQELSFQQNIGKLLWVSVSDREPYYAAGAEALGTVLISSSSSMPENFKSYYNGPQVGRNNRWWEEWSAASSAAAKVVGLEEKHPSTMSRMNARGWEHNGLSVINAVMIAAQGLDLARRAGCAATASSPVEPKECLIHSSDAINSLPVIIRNNLTDLESSHAADILIHGNHHSAPSPALADGHQFLGFNPASNQLVQNFKIYNLRHLQANSIGFVKFGDFNQRQGMRLNAAKARYYSNGLQSSALKTDQPLDSVKSQCQNESKCRSPEAQLKQPHQSGGGGGEMAGNSEPASLFKLDHPAFGEQAAGFTSGELPDRMQEVSHHLYTGAASKHFYTMSTGGSTHFNWSKSPEDRFNVIVLLPLHKTTNNRCQTQSHLDMQAFQWLTAIAYAQQQISSTTTTTATNASLTNPPVHLSTTIIDYCGQEEVARQLLAAYLDSNEKPAFAHLGEPISLLDFDSKLAETLEKELEEEELTHITFDRPPVSHIINVPSKPEFIFPSEMLEIEALVDLIGRVGGSHWKMVHLIFTDSEEYRDRFLNLAILRGICVNKIISISGKTEASAASDAQSAGTSNSMYQEDIRQIFENNFPANTNETRILVVLGSLKPETNQLILESATDSMLDDYAWIVNHNWIQSIEIQAEKSELNWDHQGDFIHRLPANLIGTRLEAPEDKEFRSFMGTLNPNKYTAQVPATLLDQFWQQNFNCTLPVAGNSLSLATCENKLQLDPQALEIDYRVPYIIKVMKDLYRTLESHKIGSRNFREYLIPERYKYGFEIVHRLRSIQTETRRRKQRMQNSRRLVLDSNLPLVTVGSWHLKSRLLLKPELEVLGKNLAGSGVQIESEVYESLHGLSLINSSCNTNRSCLSCQKQREHEIAISERNRAKSTLNARNLPQVVDWLPKLSEQQDGLVAASSSSQVFRSSGYEAFPPSSSHQSKPQPPNRSIASRHEYSSINGFSLTEALAISILSLISAIFLLFVMSFLYPSALERKQNSSLRYLTPENLDHQMTSISDYFLFAGLLMLCSINVAFLLPATMTICWFRRIGLATSYTVILSSILVMVISCYLRRVSKGKKSSSNQSFDITNVIVANQESYQAEDEVEITFESLPQEGTSQNSHVHDTRPIRQESRSNHLETDEKVHNKRSSGSRPDSPTSLMGLLISLITVQVLVSLAWSVKQPPEPTLYQGCWRCASPHRSPTLFLYELFLSLVYPALLLLPTWFLSIVTFRSVSKDQDQYIKTNILNANETQQTHSQSTLNEIQRLKGQMRDAKALVLTTTSLIILWSLTTLTMISKSHPLLATTTTTTTNDHHLHEPLAQRFDESTLVYANLITTFLVYLLLFNYRLRLLGSLRCPSNMLKQHHQRTISNEQSCLSDGSNIMKHSSANGPKSRSKSLFSSSSISSRQELLRLHQFNTYCTYSATSQLSTDQLGRDGYYSASGSQSQRSANNKARLGGKIKKRGRTPFFSLNTSSTTSGSASGECKGSRKQQLESTSTGGLHRRQSASSVTSSRAQLVFDDSNSISYCADDDDDDCDINYLDDTISYTSSVASSSTSQLQGNELYPLDYSIQLDATQLAANGGGTNGEGPSRLINRLSLRRNSSFRNNVKLSSVTEEKSKETN